MRFIIAHRGAPRLAIENTIAALEAAAKAGAQCAECDVQLTADEVPVILHDDTLDRTTRMSGFLSQTPFEQLRKYAPEVPTLIEWLQCAVRLNVYLNLELKVFDTNQIAFLAQALVSDIAQYWPKNVLPPLISSADQDALMAVNKLNPQLPLALISGEYVPIEKLSALKKTFFALHLPHQVLSQDYVHAIHQHELRVRAFTVNDAARMHELEDMGVDGVFTDNHLLYR